MKVTIVLSVVLSVALASPLQRVDVQQDTLGNYNLDINVAGLTRSERGGADGNVAGAYSFIGGDGLPYSVQYTAGIGGFRAFGPHLPVAPLPVQDTFEVAQAKAAHFAALQRAALPF